MAKKTAYGTSKTLYSSFIRKRDGKCRKCGSTKSLQCSHIRSIGAYKYLEFEPQNAIALCLRCHLYWWHKEPIDASKWFRETFPEIDAYLNERIRQHHQTTIKEKHDYIAMNADLRSMLSSLSTNE